MFNLIFNKYFSFLFTVKEIGNGRSPLLQDPLYGSRPQPYSKYQIKYNYVVAHIQSYIFP